MTGPVVVGLDGSAASVTAAWWAAREAVSIRLPVLQVHSWTSQPLNVPIPQEALSKQRYGDQVLHGMESELLHRHPDLSLTTELVSAPASQALVDLSDSAALLVLGSRGHGSVATFLLRSISLHVLGLTQRPAVTVRAHDPAVEGGWGHPAAAARDEIVVGVQEPGPASDPLLEFAFATAQSRAARVRAVRALPPSSLGTLPGEGLEADQRTRLTAALAPWREKFPAVAVAAHVATGPAAQALLSAFVRACLTVVGRGRHPSHLTWKFGPVAHAALHHVPCPVTVVPHD
ncbi:universal stress protein [Streptomyces sp. NPDC006365]|uniref:universal stress protein n=1 Tax=Streptomyces sp. NPDC006365 TaxID=3364744 RepID=UPI0036A7FB6E